VADPGGFVGFERTPFGRVWLLKTLELRLYQSSSVRDIFTQIVPQLYTTWHGMLLIYNRDGKGGKRKERRGKWEGKAYKKEGVR